MSEDFPALSGFRAGSLLAGYRLEAQVGAGGMAVVFRARDQRLGRVVALKILAPALAADAEFRRRFIAESRAAAAVDDPHIIPVHEAGQAGGVLFIAMRFVVGGDLRRVLEREGALLPGRAAGFLSPVASALDAAHAAGLVHRDVKPANILVDAKEGRPDHVYLSDFGVSKGAVSSVSLTGTGQFLGTPHYSAPEQIQGRAVDGRADQYALACVAYQLLTGTVPFERDQGLAVLLAHLSEPPPSLGSRRPALPGAADRVLARGMAKAPEERYRSCGDFADALREALGLAPYYPRGPASAPDHPQTLNVSPLPGLPGPAAASPAAAAVPPVTQTAPSPAYSAAGRADAGPDAGPAAPPADGEQRATPPSRDDHSREATGASGPGEKMPRAPRPRRDLVSPPPPARRFRRPGKPAGHRVMAPAAHTGQPEGPAPSTTRPIGDGPPAGGTAEPGAEPESSRWDHQAERGFWLLIYLTPIIFLSGVPLLLFLIFKRKGLVRMNAIQSLEVYLIAVLATVFFTWEQLAGQAHLEAHRGDASAGLWPLILLGVLSGICCAVFIGLLLFCVIQVARGKQPRIRGLTRIAYRLAYGRT